MSATAQKLFIVVGQVYVGGCALVCDWVGGCVGWWVAWLAPAPPPPPTTNDLLFGDARQSRNVAWGLGGYRWVGQACEKEISCCVVAGQVDVCGCALLCVSW